MVQTTIKLAWKNPDHRPFNWIYRFAKTGPQIARVGGVKTSQTSSCNTFCPNLPCWICNAMMPNRQATLGFEMPVLWLWTWYWPWRTKALEPTLFWDLINQKSWRIGHREERFRPEVLIKAGYAGKKVEPSYRLPVDRNHWQTLSQLANRRSRRNSRQQLTFKAEVKTSRMRWWLTYTALGNQFWTRWQQGRCRASLDLVL